MLGFLWIPGNSYYWVKSSLNINENEKENEKARIEK